MTLEEFAQLNKRVIENQGLMEFEPTACFPQRRDIQVLVELPADADVEAEVVRWAMAKSQPGEEFLVAFRVSENAIKMTRFESGQSESQFISIPQHLDT